MTTFTINFPKGKIGETIREYLGAGLIAVEIPETQKQLIELCRSGEKCELTFNQLYCLKERVATILITKRDHVTSRLYNWTANHQNKLYDFSCKLADLIKSHVFESVNTRLVNKKYLERLEIIATFIEENGEMSEFDQDTVNEVCEILGLDEDDFVRSTDREIVDDLIDRLKNFKNA